MPGTTDTLSGHEDSDGSRATRRLNLASRCIALVLSALALCLHGLNFVKAGGFWRDEANSITLSLLPDLGSVWTALQHDSFPILHYLVIRGWALLFGSGDSSLRLLGLLVGILLVAAFWYAADSLGGRAPLISLLLVGLNPVAIRFLDALRPSGLACLASVLAFALVWRALRQPDAKHLAAATVLLVCCVQLLFQAAIIVLAIGIAAIVSAYYQGGMRRALLLAMPFVAAALSLIPYRAHIQRAAEWAPVAMAPPEGRDLLPGLLKAINVPFPWMKWLWLVLVVLAIYGAVRGGLFSACRQGYDRERLGRCLYCGLTLALSTVLFVLFFATVSGITPKAWHYLPLLVMVVIAAEPMLEQLVSTCSRRIGLLAVATLLTAITLGYSVQQLQMRFTSMDIVAASIAREAGPNDLVVLLPWFYGVSFHRYYHGRAPWVSFPILREKSLHRFDLLKEKMIHPQAVAEDLANIMATLKRGGRVWVVGAFVGLQDTPVTLLPAAPLPHSGWSSSPYLTNWNRYLMTALVTHAREGEEVSSAGVKMVAAQEKPSIMLFQGYKE